ncbi:testis-expressed protein 47 isoform X2 [Xenopus tropicalis]|uniref:Testis-expressed protein 47 isoform X2 n=1 Tax=Xenopus tropicalis TaxID=8364 RepID=A0A8J1IYE2_XENTR|nr:testis-expressed protein 47 isoform X2 [Xenopus tropicalis]
MEDHGKARETPWKSEAASEKNGTSYFHQLLNRRIVMSAREDVKCLLHRLIFVSKLSADLADKRGLGDYWEGQFQRYSQGEAVTGLLLLYPSYTIHVLESSSEVLYCVLHELARMKKQGGRALVLDPKILVMSHNIPNRLFNQWCYKVLNVPGQHLADKYNESSTDGIVTECLTKLLQIGKHLTKYPKGSKNIPDSVFEKVPELIIPQGSIHHLLNCKELPTPDQFLQSYDSPLNVLLDSGHVFGSINQSRV